MSGVQLTEFSTIFFVILALLFVVIFGFTELVPSEESGIRSLKNPTH